MGLFIAMNSFRALFFVSAASGFNVPGFSSNQRVPNSCSTLTGGTCVFPFIYYNTMRTLGLGSNTTGAPSLRQGTSLQTISTQLSDESHVNYGVNNHPNYESQVNYVVSNNPNYHNRRSSLQQSGRGPRTRRAPSEDCVAEELPGREGVRQERGQVV